MNMEIEKTTAQLEAENQMLRRELKVAREAAAITARLVVKQFEKTDRTLHHLEAANCPAPGGAGCHHPAVHHLHRP